MSMTVQEYSEMRTLWEDIKKVYDDLQKEVKSYKEEGQENKNKLDKMEERMQHFDQLASRPPIAPADQEAERKSNAMKSFLQACRLGYHTLNAEQKALVPTAKASDAPPIPGLEIKGLTVTEDTTGGFLAPPEFDTTIIKGFVAYSPMRQYARVRQTSARSVQMAKRTGTITAQWVGEKTTRTELTGYSLGRVEIPTNEMYALVLISEQDLEDPVFDIETEIRSEFSEQFGVAEGKAFLSGDSSLQPQGILKHTGIKDIHSTSAGAILSDSLMDCLYDLPDVYAAQARWYMQRKTIGAVRKLRYTVGTNEYIWEPSIQPGAPSQLLGVPVVEVADMPAIATDADAILLGDLARAYVILNRVGMTFKRLSERWVENSQIGIYARMRVGGQVVLPEALRLYRLSA